MHINNLRWENVATKSQEERLVGEFVREFQGLIDFLKGDLPFSSLLADGGERTSIEIRGQYNITIRVSAHDFPSFSFRYGDNMQLDLDGGWQLTKIIRDGRFYPWHARQAKESLMSKRQHLFEIGKQALDCNGGLTASLQELKKLRASPALKDIINFSLELKGRNDSLGIGNNGTLYWYGGGIHHLIEEGMIESFLEMYGVSQPIICRVRKMIEF